MGLSTGDLLDILVFQGLDNLWLRLVRAAILILGHELSVRVAKLATASSTPRVKPAFRRKGNCVGIAACNLNNLYIGEQLDEARRRLVRIPFNIGWQILHGLEAKLAASTGSPGVHVAFDVDSNRVAVTSCDLVNSFISQLPDLQRVGLEGVTLSVLRHLSDDLVRVA